MPTLKIEVSGEPDEALCGFATVAKITRGWDVQFVEPGHSEKARHNAEVIWASMAPRFYLEESQ